MRLLLQNVEIILDYPFSLTSSMSALLFSFSSALTHTIT